MKAYVVSRNADMVEGRGPMIPVRYYLNKERAIEWMDQQPGCMGRRGEWSKLCYGDWEIREIEIIEGVDHD